MALTCEPGGCITEGWNLHWDDLLDSATGLNKIGQTFYSISLRHGYRQFSGGFRGTRSCTVGCRVQSLQSVSILTSHGHDGILSINLSKRVSSFAAWSVDSKCDEARDRAITQTVALAKKAAWTLSTANVHGILCSQYFGLMVSFRSRVGILRLKLIL
jgi:hypothetical protein